ncbi:putative F-box protein At3g52320 isoform X3 [Panicum virgatum]|uniref:putative F-box protein At3g52320 isoform X3 n=1 Tax=Panicum virgatum TaxID=38727 RepID=UPI0019D6193D|nr:putative F-box protein At3g52320 isoform X3 [Panicum virgatum]
MGTEDGLDAEQGAAATTAGGLPDDAVVEILSRVPARSIHRFKCVSKPWRDLIADPLHRKRLPQTLEGFVCCAVAGASFHGRFISLPGRSAPPVDPSFSFLSKLPWIENIKLLGSCNGLLLFEHGRNPATAPAYAVCNPATEECVAVPSAGRPSPGPVLQERTYLIFDPAVSPHFHLVYVWQEDFLGEIEVRAYSSETRVWSDWASQQRRLQDEGRVFDNYAG